MWMFLDRSVFPSVEINVAVANQRIKNKNSFYFCGLCLFLKNFFSRIYF